MSLEDLYKEGQRIKDEFRELINDKPDTFSVSKLNQFNRNSISLSRHTYFYIRDNMEDIEVLPVLFEELEVTNKILKYLVNKGENANRKYIEMIYSSDIEVRDLGLTLLDNEKD